MLNLFVKKGVMKNIIVIIFMNSYNVMFKIESKS